MAVKRHNFGMSTHCTNTSLFCWYYCSCWI